MLRLCCLSVSVLLFCGFAGCSGGPALEPPVPVKGKVTLKGKAVDGATVTFIGLNGARSASGRTAADGTFKLTTAKTDDGAPPGDYTVTISKIQSKFGESSTDVSSGTFGADYGAQMQAAGQGNMSSVYKFDIPEKYSNPAESGLKRTVTKGDANEFEFDL